ncbi:hypothetical protein MSNKSG1_17665 [Marinobacter santoriniensis NKSG1]|uniref:DUF6160 domain-containing protein n=1 Tax=Marinobacter santoriniensis NKSG1 TaxID=1288826 RepID=M7CK68_9GAMM|nr:DUF6160 family protein [Marinobacter santoriniensis]EMP54061.1 hypothetical protein MSNKSG1_17665 [Marinobacter santoriniensis NKSG1]
MMRQTIVAGLTTLLLPLPVSADLKRLDDNAMADIQGQSGITLEMDVGVSADRVSYYDDGQGVHLEGFRVGSSVTPDAPAHHEITIDVGQDASLNLDYLVEDRRIEFGDVRLAGAPDVSMGGLFLDQSLQGSLTMRSGGATGHGYTFDTAYTMTGGRLGYRTNGNEVFLDDITLTVEALGTTLDVVGNTLTLNSPSVVGSLDVGAIRYSGNSLNHGRSTDATTGALLPSYGGLSLDYDLSSRTDLTAGGRSGEGLRIDHETTIHSANFLYRDDTHALALRDMSGRYQISDLRLDVDHDWKGRPALALTLGTLEGDLHIGAIEMGANGKSIGQVNVSFLFQDQVFNGRTYTNAVYLQGGGHPDAGPQGLRMAAEWSLSLADLSYTEDGNRVIFSGLQSWGQGDITVNVTRDETRNGTRFYDGLRIGFDGVKAGYRINGLKVGDENAPLQGGTELLLALGFYPAYEFEMGGHITLAPGGATGEGLTVNSDIQLHSGKAAVIAAPYDEGSGEIPQKGLWLTEVEYDGHVRDMTLDVTDEGLVLGTGESWSTMDIGNVRVGDKNSGGSFGRLVLQKFEKGSTMTIVPGGAGDVCAGGVGSSASACAASGGIWQQRGDEGITIRLKQLLAPADGSGRKNAIAWETNRSSDASGNAVNGTGTQLVLNDIYTSDGGDFDGDGRDDNTFGIRTDLAVDVYQTKVVKKTDGADSLGVTGNRGDEKIMDSSVAQGYRYVANPTPEEILDRPLGFAVKAESRFKELSINRVDLVHPVGGTQTAIYGIKMQNFDIKANLTATPIP